MRKSSPVRHSTAKNAASRSCSCAMNRVYRGVFLSAFLFFSSAFFSSSAWGDSQGEPQIDALDFLRYYASNLQDIHSQIEHSSASGDFLRFRGYRLISYTAYKNMRTKELGQIQKPLVFFVGTLAGKPTYRELGGVSIDARAQGEDSKSRPIYLQFQGRYFSDLLTLHASESSFYALCVPTPLRHCLLLGIGERW